MDAPRRKSEKEPGLPDQAGTQQQERDWQAQNQEALASSNAYVERYGLPLERHRLF